MRLDALVRLINALEFYQLRELALKYLSLIGYTNPSLTDGWSDGGTDLRVMRADGATASLVVQVSVEKTWEHKLRADLKKAKRNYQPTSFFYVSSRRIPELAFSRLATEMRDKGTALIKVDAQALASAFFDKSQTQSILDIAGLTDILRPTHAPKPRAEEEAAYAYLFLSEDVQDFRERVLERSIIGHLLSGVDGVRRSQLLDSIAPTVGLSSNQRAQAASAVDRLLTIGTVLQQAGVLRLPEQLRRERLAQRALIDASWSELAEELAEVVRRQLPQPRRKNVQPDAILGLIGPAIALSSELTASGIAGSSRKRSDIFPKLRQRLADLLTLLQDWGMEEAGDREATVAALVSAASDTQAGQALVAAELFLSLTSLPATRLAQALGEARLPPVLLDASVAMPILLSKLHEPVPTRFFKSAEELERQARAHGVSLLLPDDYLEEAAVHLIDAWHDYGPLLDTVEALQGSTNAYVSHYAYLRKAGKASDFKTYLSTLGVREHVLSSGTFPEQRRIVMQHLRTAFSRYDIAVSPLGRPGGDGFAIAQSEVRTVSAELGRARKDLLQQHDARAIVHLDSLVGASAPILCSWDRVLLEVQTGSSQLRV